MSRQSLAAKNPDYHIAFGYDSFCGYFFQLFGPDVGDEEVVLVDLDETFGGLTTEHLAELLETHAAPTKERDRAISALRLK